MYSYNNMTPANTNNYQTTNYGYYNNYPTESDDRFAGGLLAPLFLGGVAGYAIGYNRPNNQGGYYYPYPPQPMPMPMYTNNYYYPYY